MIKKVIFFDDINLYNRCEVEAKRNNFIDGTDFIVFCLENYFKKIGKEKSYKKPIELWLDCENEARKMETEVAQFIEAVCRQALDGIPPKDGKEISERKRTIWQRVNDVLSLPRA